MGELRPDIAANLLDDFILVEEIDLSFRGMNVNIYTARFNLEAEVDERMAPFW
jgi:hypothetical protein